MRLSDNDLFLLCQCAISAAYQAGHLIAQYSQRTVTVSSKDQGSLAAQVVTEVDHLSQKLILKTLKPSCERFDLALVSEESPDDRQRLAKDFFWCIDPLDGTLPFIESLPGYSVSIALVSQAGVSLIGVVYDPLSQNLYYAIKGQGAWLNHQSLIKPPTPVFNQQALVFITDKSFLDDTRYQATSLGLQQIALELGFSSVELRLQGGAAMNACQALTLPACSYFKWPKAQIGGGSIWDYAASVCIYQEIGAFASASNGEPLVLNPHGSTFMNHCGILYCANNQLAEKMILLHEKLQVSAG